MVNGTLDAQGTITDSIIFKHNTAGQHYAGIRFEGASSGGTLEYCRIQDGTRTYGGVLYIDIASPTVKHCTIRNGIVLPEKNKTLLEEKILLIYNNKEVRDRIGNNAREYMSVNNLDQRHWVYNVYLTAFSSFLKSKTK